MIPETKRDAPSSSGPESPQAPTLACAASGQWRARSVVCILNWEMMPLPCTSSAKDATSSPADCNCGSVRTEEEQEGLSEEKQETGRKWENIRARERNKSKDKGGLQNLSSMERMSFPAH